MGVNQVPGIGPANTDVANAVAAVLPTATNIQNLATTYGNAAAGIPNWTLQQTLTASSNNVSVPNASVFAVVASGGTPGTIFNANNDYSDRYGGIGGTVVMGIVPASTRVVVAASGFGGSSAYGNLVASAPNYWQTATGATSNNTLTSGVVWPIGVSGSYGGIGARASVSTSATGQSLATGGGGLGSNGFNTGGNTPTIPATAGGNSTLGYTGGNGGNGPAGAAYGSGGGGGAGIAGNGQQGGAAGNNDYGRGGVGGIGGGGAGSDGKNQYNSSWPVSFPYGNGNGGQGAVLLFY